MNAEGAPPVWKSDLPESANGIVVLGAPIGTDAFVEALMDERLRKQQLLVDQLHNLGKLQNEWLLLYFCCAPRATYFLRTGKPSQIRGYAQKHDAMILKAFCRIMGIREGSMSLETLQQINLPLRMGGLGLRDNCRILPAAYWSSWADVLPTLCKRMPWYSAWFYAQSIGEEISANMFDELNECKTSLGTSGFAPPDWSELVEGTAITDEYVVPDAGERKTGWQLKASNACGVLSFDSLLSIVPRPGMSLYDVNTFKARLRSCGGERTSQWLITLPTGTNLALDDCELKCSILRRIGLPIDVLQNACEGCGKDLDRDGRHRATCMRTGRVQIRHKPFVKIWVQILREASIYVPEKKYWNEY